MERACIYLSSLSVSEQKNILSNGLSNAKLIHEWYGSTLFLEGVILTDIEGRMTKEDLIEKFIYELSERLAYKKLRRDLLADCFNFTLKG